MAANGVNGANGVEQDFSAIPRLDYRQLASDRQEFLAQLRDALVNVGFMYISNLPVAHLIDEIKRQARLFFDLPLEEKLRLEMKNRPYFLGYSRQGNELTKGRTDNREQLDLGNERPCTWTKGQPEYLRVWGPNQWPIEESAPGFRTTFEDFMEEMAPLSIEFTSLIAESLGLPKDAFQRFYEVPFESMQHRLKIIKYPAVDELPEGSDNQGVGPHFDGWLTFLLQADDLPGLQVQNRRGDWLDVTPVPGTFVVNIGKGLETVTQGVAIATTHRVLNPPPGRGPRYSVPFFQNISREAVLGDLTFEMPQSALDLRDRRGGPVVSDSGNYQEVSQLNMGQTTLINRIRAHPDAGKPHYPALYAQLFPNDSS